MTFWKSVGGGLAAFAAAATMYQWGHSNAVNESQNLVSLLKEQKSSIEKRIEFTTKENESLKSQLLSAEIDSKHGAAPVVSLPVDTGVSNKEKDTPGNNQNVETIVLQKQSSAILFDGEIQLSLTATDFGGDPLRHRVIAFATLPGEDPVKMDLADVGEAIKVGSFQVTITSSSTYSAGFTVYRVNGIEGQER